MRVRAQVGMVMSLDKCIGCHTCSVTCKQVWTNRPGTEYVWFNNVETKPGLGYPRRWEDNEQWRGGWELDRKGRLRLKGGGQIRKLVDCCGAVRNRINGDAALTGYCYSGRRVFCVMYYDTKIKC